MIMIAHQAIGVNLPIGFLARFGQGLQEILPVHVIEKNILAPVAAAHDVIQGAGILDAPFAGHRAQSAAKISAGQAKIRTSMG